MTAGKRRIKDIIAGRAMLVTTAFSTGLVFAIAMGLYLRARPLLASQPLFGLFFGETWLPSEGQFGLKPFIVGTVWVTAIAIIIALPLCLLTAVFLAEYAPQRVRSIVKPLIDLLAGIPSVVYGVWGILVVVPFIADRLGPFAVANLKSVPYLSTEYSAGFSVLAGGVVLAIMVFPVIISVSEEVLRAVPAEQREAALALGATKFETIRKVVIRKALPGLLAAVVLGVSRALGETMAVLMVAGNVPMAPKSVFDACYPLPALIANNYGEVMSIPMYDSALLGSALILLIFVLFFNIAARTVFGRMLREHIQ
ncbi:MAG: phosphate ABC transporter permease subunit PstC [Armatimonadetes bacterium]|nr:phosphate ABC transporter permease subunit PstC [Armatimonadota bacterium]